MSFFHIQELTYHRFTLKEILFIALFRRNDILSATKPKSQAWLDLEKAYDMKTIDDILRAIDYTGLFYEDRCHLEQSALNKAEQLSKRNKLGRYLKDYLYGEIIDVLIDIAAKET